MWLLLLPLPLLVLVLLVLLVLLLLPPPPLLLLLLLTVSSLPCCSSLLTVRCCCWVCGGGGGGGGGGSGTSQLPLRKKCRKMNVASSFPLEFVPPSESMLAAGGPELLLPNHSWEGVNAPRSGGKSALRVPPAPAPAAATKRAFFGVFPMFVPSLSW